MIENYSFKQDIIKSLEITINSNGKFTYFYNSLFPKGIKFYFSQSSIDWVLKYKKLNISDFLKQKKILNIKIEDKLFFFIYYFYAFIINDIWHLNKHIPKKINKILNIGSGICLFEIYLNYINKKIDNFYIIEKNNLNHNNELINVLDMAKDTIEVNNLTQRFNFYDDQDYVKMNVKFDLILSFRSWCYKYDIDTYLDFVCKSINKNSVLIIDIRNEFEEEKILNHFMTYKIITNYPYHKRYYISNFKIN